MTTEATRNTPGRVAPLWTPSDIGVIAQLACLLEASAPKPGNVSPGVDFRDASYTDFLASAAAIGGPLGSAGTRPLGHTIRLAVSVTQQWTRSNTNLGIVLLLAPLARAASVLAESPRGQASDGDTRHAALRRALTEVLGETSIADAREVYAAIREASPGGLGRVDQQDVAAEPTVTLREAMRLAANRDDIAREYATDFALTFGIGVPTLDRARNDGLCWEDAIVETFLTILAERHDTHIIRRRGTAVASEVSAQARAAIAAGGVRGADGRARIERMRRTWRDDLNSANPGTSADLTAAAIFVVLHGGGWHAGGGWHGTTR